MESSVGVNETTNAECDSIQVTFELDKAYENFQEL